MKSTPSRILLAWVCLPAVLVAGSGWLALRAERERLLGEWRTRGQESARRMAAEVAVGWGELTQWELPVVDGGIEEDGGLRLGETRYFFFPAAPQPQSRHEAQDWMEAGEWARVVREAPGALSEAGLPLGPLAALRGLREEKDSRARLWEDLVELAVRRHPSVVSRALLEEAAGLLDDRKDEAAKALAEWDEDERLRAGVLRELDGWRQSPAAGWLGGMFVFFHTGEGGQGWRMVKEREVAQLLEKAGRHAPSPLPAFVGYVVSVQGVVIGSAGDAVAQGEPLAFAEEGPVRVAWMWRDGPAFRAEMLRRMKWTGGALALALLGCAAAGWQTLRAFHRQEQLAEQRSNFLSSVSHELRTPLASLRLMTENLIDGTVTDGARVREYLEVMHDESARLATLAGNVLDAARMERGVKRYAFAPLHPGALVTGVLRLLRVRAERLNITLHDEVAAIDPPPTGDTEALHQALLNLLDNALKHAPPGTAVGVTSRAMDADTWLLEVSDQGPGIAEAEREKVWEPFYRTGSELRRETTGAGLGLSLVRHIASGHGGRAEIDNAPGGGLVARLILQRRPECES